MRNKTKHFRDEKGMLIYGESKGYKSENHLKLVFNKKYQVSRDPILIKKTFLNEEITLNEGEERPMQISMRGLMSEVQDDARDDNVIVLEITGSNGDKMGFNDVEVISRMYVPETEFVTIRPKIIRGDND